MKYTLNELPIVVSDMAPDSGFYSHYIDSWENAVKHKKTGQDFIWIHYSGSRDTSRWKSTPRARPFLVEHVSSKNIGWNRLGAFKTLEAAIISATEYARKGA